MTACCFVRRGVIEVMLWSSFKGGLNRSHEILFRSLPRKTLCDWRKKSRVGVFTFYQVKAVYIQSDHFTLSRMFGIKQL